MFVDAFLDGVLDILEGLAEDLEPPTTLQECVNWLILISVLYAYIWPEPQNGRAFCYDEEYIRSLMPPPSLEEREKRIAELRANRNGLSALGEGWDSVDLQRNLSGICTTREPCTAQITEPIPQSTRGKRRELSRIAESPDEYESEPRKGPERVTSPPIESRIPGHFHLHAFVPKFTAGSFKAK